MSSDDREAFLRQVYGAQNGEELTSIYDDWATRYDSDLTAFGYRNPAVAAGLIGRHIDADSGTLLDAGCGTGLLGEILSYMGYLDLAGIDLSQGMLDQAAVKSVYTNLKQMALGTELAFEDGRFAAVVSFGVLTAGHAPPQSLDEMIRITKPGGHLIFSLSNLVYEPLGFKDKLASLAAQGRWREIERTPFFPVLPGSVSEATVESCIFVFQTEQIPLHVREQ
ncbi:MAG: class I SAM-dependent methyltransferase [Rhodospirillaceae bacterium]|jgi:predicted TPR repeat methyltransferase|nr:class I SAM-dependent methyltransferase [Rhodospirillaceae bacterium]MBT5243718.1 class I SAM-dependent methyltransferase [Rhodospirillaceae bacterium]MBT5563815.1 class I SAM-dependent methyltransferase [Rhodospirillaceae bacterium]MBT6241696.1 class I SAM-dependent methyltransferase [Rhodospirillaceae bacterium]MBT7138186.1 class I SAM-dependent methyltransferase [Rhodospirillaceae bacterium]